MKLGVLIFFLSCVSVFAPEKAAYSYQDTDMHVITPEDFFRKFNIRTIISSLGPRLKYYCGKFPSDFFKEYTVKLNKMTLVNDQTHIWILDFENNNEASFHNRIDRGTFLHIDYLYFKFDPQTETWVGGEVLYPETSDCVPFQDPEPESSLSK